MVKSIKLKLRSKTNFKYENEYRECVVDLINNPVVQSMEEFIQHSDISCFEHCINVSYNSYLICRRLHLNYQAAARGGLLHDLFLYDWHISKPEKGLHGFAHPFIALENANKYFNLNDVEKDIIEKHMWPLTVKMPKYKEALIVSFVDKYCAFMETIKAHNGEYISRMKVKLESDKGATKSDS
jgi:Predicted HD superfamily hydrolase